MMGAASTIVTSRTTHTTRANPGTVRLLESYQDFIYTKLGDNTPAGNVIKRSFARRSSAELVFARENILDHPRAIACRDESNHISNRYGITIPIDLTASTLRLLDDGSAVG